MRHWSLDGTHCYLCGRPQAQAEQFDRMEVEGHGEWHRCEETCWCWTFCFEDCEVDHEDLILDLRARVEELEAENERLTEQLWQMIERVD